MQGRLYTVPTGHNAITVAQDAIEAVAAATGIIGLKRFAIGQSTEAGDAADEQLQITVSRVVGAFTSGSGGASVTPAPVDQEGAAASFTAERNNTTQISGGTSTVMFSDAFNVRAGYQYIATPGEEIIASPTDAIVIAISAPADSVTFAVTAVFEEVGT